MTKIFWEPDPDTDSHFHKFKDEINQSFDKEFFGKDTCGCCCIEYESKCMKGSNKRSDNKVKIQSCQQKRRKLTDENE